MTARRPSAEEGDFLGRWSRLKRERATEQPAPEPEPAPPSEAADAPAESVKTDEEVLEELGLPHPETLRPGDDFSVFMAKAVPEHLRRIALRKLWSSNPVLACLDGLNDYEDDYTDAALAVKTLATNYKVGRGFRPLDDEAAPVATATSPDAAEDAQSDDDIAAADHDEAEAASAATETALSSSLRAPEEVRDETPEASRDAADPSPERLAERTEAPIPARRARIRFHQAD